ncbi:MAG TPA: Hsp20/alpha crystallin family protein [Paenibacillus sp.]|nr:Hsp20/alpha crystallin family protein [Paenibacillus sp.]
MQDVWKDRRFRNGWKTFESMIRRKLREMRQSPGEYEWDRLMRESLAFLEKHRASGYAWECFETFKSVIVRVTLPLDGGDKLPRVHVEERRLTLTGIPGKLDETIELPAAVVPKKPRAVYADGVVEIRLRKRSAVRPTRAVRCSAKKSPSAR